MAMTSHYLYCCLLVFAHVFEHIHGSIDEIQYRLQSVDNNADAIARCTKQVISSLFESSNRIVVVVSQNSLRNKSTLDDDFLKLLANAENAATVVNEFGFQEQMLEPHWHILNGDSSYVIIEDDFDNLSKIFQNDNKLYMWSEYLIVTKITEDLLKTFAMSLLQRGFLRFAFIHIENYKTSIVFRRFEELRKVSSHLDQTELKAVSICETDSDNSDKKNVLDGIEPFSKIRCPTKGCYLSVVRVKDDMEGSSLIANNRQEFNTADRIVNLFAIKNNIKLRNRFFDELEWSETLDHIVSNDIDVTYGNFIPRTGGLELMDIVTWFDFERVIFLDTSRGTVVAPLTKFFNPLDTYVWLCILLLLCVYSIFAWAIRKAHKKKMIGETTEMFNIWAILLSQGVRHPVNIGLRVMLGMWMLTALLINASYGSAFRSSLASFARINPLRNLNDINRSGKQVAGSSVARELFNNSHDEGAREIYEKWKVVPPDQVFSVVSKEGMVGVDVEFNVILHNLITRRRFTPGFYTINEPILVYPLNYYLKKYHPYVVPLRKIAIQARSTGLMEKWDNEHFQTVRRRMRRRFSHRFNFNRTVKMGHLSVSFKIWGAGNLIAVITFFYEFYKSARLKKKTLKNGKSTKLCRIINMESPHSRATGRGSRVSRV